MKTILKNGWVWLGIIALIIFLIIWLKPNYSKRLLKDLIQEDQEKIVQAQQQADSLTKVIDIQELTLLALDNRIDSLRASSAQREAENRRLQNLIYRQNEKLNDYRCGTFDERAAAFTRLFDQDGTNN